MTAPQVAKAFGVKRIGSGRKFRARCPVHHSRGKTLAIYDDGDHVGVYCHAGCPQKDVLAAVGLTWRDLNPNWHMTPEIARRLSLRDQRESLEQELGWIIMLETIERKTKYWYWRAAERRVRQQLRDVICQE